MVQGHFKESRAKGDIQNSKVQQALGNELAQRLEQVVDLFGRSRARLDARLGEQAKGSFDVALVGLVRSTPHVERVLAEFLGRGCIELQRRTHTRAFFAHVFNLQDGRRASKQV